MRLNDSQESRLKRFLNDRETSEILFDVLQDSFLKARANKEVHYLAAKSLAVEFLEEARRDLDKYREAKDNDRNDSPTPHV